MDAAIIGIVVSKLYYLRYDYKLIVHVYQRENDFAMKLDEKYICLIIN